MIIFKCLSMEIVQWHFFTWNLLVESISRSWLAFPAGQKCWSEASFPVYEVICSVSCASTGSQGRALVSLTTQGFKGFTEPFVPGKLKCGVWVCSLSSSCVIWDQREKEQDFFGNAAQFFIPWYPGSSVLVQPQSWGCSCFSLVPGAPGRAPPVPEWTVQGSPAKMLIFPVSYLASPFSQSKSWSVSTAAFVHPCHGSSTKPKMINPSPNWKWRENLLKQKAGTCAGAPPGHSGEHSHPSNERNGIFSCAQGLDSVSLHLKHPRTRSTEQPLKQQKPGPVTSLFLESAVPSLPTHWAALGAGRRGCAYKPFLSSRI